MLLAAVVLPSHLEIQLDLSLVLGLMHEKVDLKGIKRQQILTVTLYDPDQLLRAELRQQIHNKLLVILQDDDSKLLEDVTEVDDFLLRLIHHGVEGIDLLHLWI